MIRDCANREHDYREVDTTTYDTLAKGYRTAIRICERCGAVEPEDQPLDPEGAY